MSVRRGSASRPRARYATQVSDLLYPLTISHRGGPNIYPENSWEAKAGTVDFGFIPEFDLQLLADGRTLVSCHDRTVDRTMNNIGRGPVSTKTVQEWRRARIKPAILGGREGRPILWDEVLDTWGGRVVLVPELKDAEAASVLIEGIVRRGLERSVLAQSFDWGVAQRTSAAGIETLFLSTEVPRQAPEELRAAGIGFVGGDLAVWTEADVAAMRAAGLVTLGFTVRTLAEASTPLALAFDGLFSDDAWLTTESIPLRSGDPFADGIKPYGMGDPYTTVVGRPAPLLAPPIRLAGRQLGFAAPSAKAPYAVQPWAGTALRRPLRVTLRLHFGPNVDDQTAGMGFALHRGPAHFVDAATPGQGAFLFLAHRDGRLSAWRYPDGGPAVPVGATEAVPGAALALPGRESAVDLVVGLTADSVSMSAQGPSGPGLVGFTSFQARNDFDPGRLSLTLRWAPSSTGSAGFISDVTVATGP
nr:glycerophosphodiester phosphodiesterase [uncultured Friedmanniella sp.]